jgi:hypothetical protein
MEPGGRGVLDTPHSRMTTCCRAANVRDTICHPRECADDDKLICPPGMSIVLRERAARCAKNLICRDGSICFYLSSPICKNISLRCHPKSNLYPSPSHPTEGRIMIVTNAGWDAVDADAPITNGTEADGEVVWS